MSIHGTQRGEGTAGCLFWILILIVVGMVSAKVIPVKIAKMQLKDHMNEIAQRHQWKNSDWFERSIYRRARDLDLDVKRNQIKVRKSDRRVRMDVEFRVPLDFGFYTYVWDVHISLDRDIFLM